MITFSPDLWKNIGVAIGSLVAGYGGAKVYRRRDRVADADANLDVTSLTAGSQMILALQQDIQRLRATMTEADSKWRADMTMLEQRLEAMGAQVDAAVTARRAAEEACAQLRYQLQQLGQKPCA